MRAMNSKKIEKIISELLMEFGENISREGLDDTPERVSKSYEKLLEGYRRDLSEEITVFENVHGYNGIITSSEIDFFSTCEHHLLPFWGTAHVGYIPDKKLIGLSKLSRAVAFILDVYRIKKELQYKLLMSLCMFLSLRV